MDSLYVYANELSPKTFRRAIRLRLIRVYLSKEYGVNEKYQNMECVGHDFQGNYIHLQIESQFVKKYKDMFTEGEVYSFKNFEVKTNRQTYKTTDAKYMMRLSRDSTVAQYKGDDFPKKMFRLQKFAELKADGGVVPTKLIDLIGRVVTIDRPRHVQVNGYPTRVIDFVIEDNLDSRLVVLAWDKHVDAVMPYYNVKLDGPLIVIIQLCRAKLTTEGEVVISTSYSATRLLFNHECPEFSTFRESMPQFYTPLRSISSASRLSSSGTIDEVSVSSIKITPIREIYENQEPGEFYAAGEIVSIQSTGEWCFIGCKGKGCGRKLQPNNGLMHYESCGRSWQEGIVKYRLTLTIMDVEEQDALLLLWDRDCNTLLDISAAELKAKYEASDEMPNEILALRGQKMVCKIVARIEQFKRDNSAFTVMNLIRDEDIVKTHCFKSRVYIEKSMVRNLADQDEFKDAEEEGIGSAEVGIGSQVDIIEIDDSTKDKTPTKKRQLLDELSASKKMKQPKIDKD